MSCGENNETKSAISLRKTLKKKIFVASIPLHIVSGFLGSGKTTFLGEVLARLPEGRRVGVIQNEFAPVNTDRYALEESGGRFALLEINNGSVFCVCLLGEFMASLEGFLHRHSPDLLILEASGFADPTSLAEIFSHSPLSGRVHVAVHWCILDAAGYARTGKMMPRVIHQLRMADIVVINKADLAGEKTHLALDFARKANPFADIITTSYCRVPFRERFLRKPRFFPDTVEALARPEVSTLVLKSTRPLPEERVPGFLAEWASRAYRIKGFIMVTGGRLLAVECTPEQTRIRPVDHSPGITELIALTDRFSGKEWEESFARFRKEEP